MLFIHHEKCLGHWKCSVPVFWTQCFVGCFLASEFWFIITILYFGCTLLVNVWNSCFLCLFFCIHNMPLCFALLLLYPEFCCYLYVSFYSELI